MHEQQDENPARQQYMTAAPATGGARYPLGPSKDRPHAGASAPGVAEGLGHQGVPEKVDPAVGDEAVRRVSQRRKRELVQRTARVDVRYSDEEKTAILAEARRLNIAAAHFVAATVMAHLEDRHQLPGQRTQLDDYIDELGALRHQVATIGRLANQVTRKLNSGGHPHPGDTATLAQAERTLNAVERAVKSIATSADQALSPKATS